MPVPTLALHSYIRHLFPHRSARLCVLLVSCVSPYLPSLCPPLTLTPCTPSLLCRINSRDRIRTKLAAGVENGIVFNPSVQASGSVSTPGPNPSRDNTEGSTGTIIDLQVVTSFRSQKIVEPSSEKVRLL